MMGFFATCCDSRCLILKYPGWLVQHAVAAGATQLAGKESVKFWPSIIDGPPSISISVMHFERVQSFAFDKFMNSKLLNQPKP